MTILYHGIENTVPSTINKTSSAHYKKIGCNTVKSVFLLGAFSLAWYKYRCYIARFSLTKMSTVIG